MLIYRLHAFLLALTLAVSPALASQNALSSPTGGTVSGLQLTNNYNNALDSLNTCNSGGSAPSNQLSASPSLGNCWWNTSTNAFQYFDGTSWVGLGWFDTASHYWQGLTGGGAINNISSATTTDLCSQKPTTVNVTGVTTITGFGSNCQVGQIKHIIFTGALTLTHNGTSLILPNGGSNITTAAGDIAEATYLGSGNWRVTDYVLANGQPLNTSAVAVGSSALLASSQGYNATLNLKLVPSIAGNALTIAIKGTNGSDPSSVNPVLIPFRDTTLVNGEMIVDSLQAPLSFTVNSGSTMGASSGVPFRLWVFAFDNGGTVVLSLIQCSNSPPQIYSCAEDQLQNTASGTIGGNSSGIFYSNASALSGKAVRILGYMEWSTPLGAAGTWNALPNKVQLFGPGVRKPGEVVQTVYVTNSTVTNVTSSTAAATNLTASITPTSAANLVRVSADGTSRTNVSGTTAICQIRRGTSTAIGNRAILGGTASTSDPVGTAAMRALDAPGVATATSYTVYISSSDNVSQVSFSFSSSPAVMILDEIMGALEPANDDRPLSAVG